MALSRETIEAVQKYCEINHDIRMVDRAIENVKEASDPGCRDKSKQSEIEGIFGIEVIQSIGPGLIELLKTEKGRLLSEQVALNG